MSSVASTEARELELVGKVELRIALAKDDKLESVLKLYLPPLLLKLGSEHTAVRNKVWITSRYLRPGNSISCIIGYLLMSTHKNQTCW